MGWVGRDGNNMSSIPPPPLPSPGGNPQERRRKGGTGRLFSELQTNGGARKTKEWLGGEKKEGEEGKMGSRGGGGKKGKVKVFVEKAENRGEEMDGQRPFPPPLPPLRFTDRTSEVRARSAPLMG